MNEISLEALQQGSAQWRALRTKLIGASDAPVIMGLSPWMTPHQLFLQKEGLYEVEENWAMARGKDMEEEARAAYEAHTGETMFATVEFNPVYPWAMASLDGINLQRNRICEIKCPGEKDHNEASRGMIPEKYQIQMQHQMMVLNLDRNDYWSYRDGRGVLITLERDELLIKKIVEKEKEFFYEYMVKHMPPPLTDSDLIEIDNEEWVYIAEKMILARESRRSFEKQEEELKNQLIEICEGKPCKSGLFRFKKTHRKGSIDYSSIPELIGIDLDEFRKPGSVCWSLTKEKEE